jgi:hypothetical protein
MDLRWEILGWVHIYALSEDEEVAANRLVRPRVFRYFMLCRVGSSTELSKVTGTQAKDNLVVINRETDAVR